MRKQKYTFEEVKDFIESKGCKLLSTEYVNNSEKLIIKCSCGEVFKKSFDKFKNGKQYRCKKCGYKIVGDKLGKERVFLKCSQCEKDLEPMPKSVANSTEHHFCNRKCYSDWCKEHRIGENNNNYNPNLTDEDRNYKRFGEDYDNFIKETLKRDDYTCLCCGKRGINLNAHHLNGHNWDKKHRTDINNGVTLCKECHTEFHKIYKNGDNTIEQFKEFLYNKYLQTKDLKYLATLEDIDIRKHIMLTNNLSLPI